MRSFALALVLLGGLNFCNTTQTVISPDDHSAGGPSGPSNVCEGLVTQLNLDIESGTSGGTAKVGTVVSASLDVRDSNGNTVPGECRQGTITATIGPPEVCTPLGNPSFESISAQTVGEGVCSIGACVGAKCSNTESFTVVP